MSRPSHRARRLALAALLGLLLLPLLPTALPASAAGELTMTARVLLQGHARIGSWMAIEVQLKNDGPSIVGELRMDGGSTSQTRFSMRVDLPTDSQKTYVLHAQPPAFGRNLKVDLMANGSSIATQTVAYLVHDAGQLVVGVLAERPQAVVAELDLPPSPTGATAVIVPMSVTDLPDRLEGWGTLDRLVWQDLDSSQLSNDQIAALRGWVASGGRLVIAAGTAGIGTLSKLPDDLLPYRPTSTIDLDPSKLAALVGPIPTGAATLPAFAGQLARGQSLVTSGGQSVAATTAYGSGSVTLIGFDPTTAWLAGTKSVEAFWRGLLPARTNDGGAVDDDSQILQAVQQLASLQLPPVGGLLLLLAAYILVVGPLNYLVLRRIDRRELAWISVPVLVVGFAAAAYGYGAVLRGTDVIVNEVAIVVGAPGATEGRAQDYFGVFSPTRATYLIEIPGGALLAAPIAGDPFGTQAGVLDIVQGDPAEVRDLAVGVAQLRTIRAETPTSVPLMHATLALAGNTISGTFENASDEALEQVAIVLGGSVAVLGDVAPHTTVPVSIALQGSNGFGMQLADRIIGQAFGGSSDADTRRSIRYTMVGQLTYDPNQGSTGQLSSDKPVVLAFGRRSPIDIRVAGTDVKRTTNVLYYVPVDVSIHGKVTFASDLVRPTVLSTDAMFFGKGGPGVFNMGVGNLVVAYRPIPFGGTLSPSLLRIGFNGGNGLLPTGGKPVDPVEAPPPCTDPNQSEPPGCEGPRQDFLPDLEIFDRSGAGAWVRLPRLGQDAPYLVTHPERYVDPSSGQVLVRFVNDNAENQLNFGFGVSIEGVVQ